MGSVRREAENTKINDKSKMEQLIEEIYEKYNPYNIAWLFLKRRIC
jgi:hypothetical protein